MSNLLKNISKMLDCTEDSVRFKLTNSSEREKVLDDIKGKALKTTYFDKNGTKKIIFCDEITTLGSHQIWAYGNLRAPFNINVSAYFHARHKISLKYPFHQCVFYKNCYYPIELLELCSVNEETDSDSSIILKNKRSHASSSSSSSSSISEISVDTVCSKSTSKEKDIHRKKKDNSHRHGILWLHDTEKKLWEKHDIILFQNKTISSKCAGSTKAGFCTTKISFISIPLFAATLLIGVFIASRFKMVNFQNGQFL
uniref:PAZ domain-containing protein n=2 Tax=Meloidogyne TaxID=189290 RepID=A0A6V7XL44_MELEN|nr:unnamed protein product [Meloidogyne enterolobii]